MSLSVRKLSILGVLVLTAVFVAGPGTTSASSKKNTAKHFDLLYHWGGKSIKDLNPLWAQEAELTLWSTGRIDVVDMGDTVLDCGDWWTQKSGKLMTIELDVGVVYTGTRQTDGSYFGTMIAPNGMKGVWSGRFVP